MYTNADQLVNKRDDLAMHIAGKEPDLILVTEVIPKAQTIPISTALLALPGYTLYTNFDLAKSNLGQSGSRGVCIYVKEGLPAVEVNLAESIPTAAQRQFSVLEQQWISVDLQNSDRLLVGCIYLSPSGDRFQGLSELDQALNAVQRQSPSHLLVAGDFNVPQIDWLNCFSDESPNHHSHTLIRCIQDHFLSQHVTRPTRFRHDQAPSTLDLILTSEEGMVHELEHLPGLGNSDHVILRFGLACYTEKGTLALPQLNYNRGDYNLLRTLLQRVDWTVLHGSDMLHAYHFFVTTLREVVTAAVPVTRPKSNKNLYMNSQARKLKREKYSLWSIYTNTKDAVDYARYCRCRNRLRKLTRDLRRNFEI